MSHRLLHKNSCTGTGLRIMLGCGLPRMRLRRSWFNRGQKKGRSCYAPALLVSGAYLTSRQGVAHVAQQPLVLALLLVSLPFRFLGFGLLSAGPLLLRRFLCSFTGP